MNGILFDRSLGLKKLSKHFQGITSIPTFTRIDVRSKNHNPKWSVPDNKYIEFAKEKGLVLVTADIQQAKWANKLGVETIWMHPNLPFWQKILRILQKLDHPFYYQVQNGILDLRCMWRDSEKWKMPKYPSSIAMKRMMESDPTFDFM